MGECIPRRSPDVLVAPRARPARSTGDGRHPRARPPEALRARPAVLVACGVPSPRSRRLAPVVEASLGRAARGNGGTPPRVLIVLSGLPGTGKSVLADSIARFFGFPVVSVDPIESAMLRSGVRPDQPTGLAAYLVAEALADSWLALGLSPIVDAVNGVSEAKEMWRTLAI